MQSIPAWLWPAAAWVILAFAAYLFASPWWRKHADRWCHRCGYNMAGLATLTCPECGRTARSEHALTRKPARKLRRAAAVLIALAAWPLAHLPRTIERGPVALVPGWALARVTPTEGTDYDFVTIRTRRSSLVVSVPIFRAGPLALPSDTLGGRVRSALFIETWSRLEDDELGDAAARAYLNRVHGEDLQTSPSALLPHAWPSDHGFDLPGPSSNPSRISTTFQMRLDPDWKAKYTPGSPPEITYTVTIGARTYDLRSQKNPIDISTPSDRFMTPVSSPEIDKAIAGMLFPRLHIFKGAATITTSGVAVSPSHAGLPFYGAFRFTVLLDDAPIGSGAGGWTGGVAMPVTTDWLPGGEAQAAAHPKRITLDIIGEPKEACRAYMTDWTHPRTAWSGKARLQPAEDYGDR